MSKSFFRPLDRAHIEFLAKLFIVALFAYLCYSAYGVLRMFW